MPSATAGRLCPAGIFVRPNMERYREESRVVMQIVGRSGAAIEQVSVDEAYLDLSALCDGKTADESLQLALPVARNIKESIRAERRLTASIGIASNKLLAKLASDQQKPDGLTLIFEAEKVQFLRPLPVHVLHGVGRVTAEQLHNEGIDTVGDLQDFKGDLRALVGSFGTVLKRFAFGEVSKEAVYVLPNGKAKLRIPTPAPFKNHGNEIVSVSSRLTRRCMRLSIRSLMCCNGMSR